MSARCHAPSPHCTSMKPIWPIVDHASTPLIAGRVAMTSAAITVVNRPTPIRTPCAMYAWAISGASLAEHESPGEASVHVLSGRVRLSAAQNSWDGRHGDLLMLPDAPHSLEALEDSAVLLTVAKQV